MASTGEVWKLGHRPALDGLRGIAVLLVLVGHGWHHPQAAGSAGVAVFFTLSGFLITALLLEEHDRTGAVALGRFYARRAVRLLPALFVFLAGMSVMRPLLGDQAPSGLGVATVLLYVNNWFPAVGMALGHMWSLAVEEQFYLFWPLLLLMVLGRVPQRVLLWVLLSVAAAATVWRVALFHSGAVAHAYAGTDTNAGGLLLGAAVAVAARHTGWSPPRWLVGVAVGAVLVLAYGGPVVVVWLVTPATVPACTAVVLLTVARGAEGPLTARWLQLVGRRSYALYLWHMPLVAVIAPSLPGPSVVWTLVMVAFAWGAACASWHLVERPCQVVWRRRRSGRGARSVVADAPAPRAALLGLRRREHPASADAQAV